MLDIIQGPGFLQNPIFQVGGVLTGMAKRARANSQSGLECFSKRWVIQRPRMNTSNGNKMFGVHDSRSTQSSEPQGCWICAVVRSTHQFDAGIVQGHRLKRLVEVGFP